MKMTWRMFTLILICLIAICAHAAESSAATLYVSDYGNGTCSLNNAQTAFNSASSGDTIVFPRGTCTWSSSLKITKPIRLLGAGNDKGGTKLIASKEMADAFFYITGFSSNEIVRISGFTFDLIDFSPRSAIKILNNNVSLSKLRIDNNTFHYGYEQIHVGGSKGVIDNNYFYNSLKGISYTAGNSEQANASWKSLAMGTGDPLFIEDNYFIDNADYPAGYSQEKIGTYNGGKLVIRYNTFDATKHPLSSTFNPIMTHGSAAGGVVNGYWQQGTGGRRGQSVVEIYENVMKGKRIDFPVIVRGSANLIYNNTVTLSAGNSPRIRMREEEYYESSNWKPLRTAWPAEDQVHNTFIWGNTYNGKAFTSSNISAESNIEENRDYFLHAPKAKGGKAIFTGLKGASGSYPTDKHKHPTLGTMVFSPDGPNAYYLYKAYTYPHPLRYSGESPLPPTGLSVKEARQ